MVSGLFAWVAGIVTWRAGSHSGFMETDCPKLSELIRPLVFLDVLLYFDGLASRAMAPFAGNPGIVLGLF